LKGRDVDYIFGTCNIRAQGKQIAQIQIAEISKCKNLDE